MTFTKDTIASIKSESSKNQWPFPKYFQTLKNAGVHAYDVDIVNLCVTYFGDNVTVVEDLKESYPQLPTSLPIAPVYDENKIKTTLAKIQARQVDYITFLKELAQAGITDYRTDMDQRAVSYNGSGKCYVEEILQS